MTFSDSTLADVCSVITDGAHNSPTSVEAGGLPMASVKDLTPYGINLSTSRRISRSDFEKLVRQGCKPLPGDVLIAKDGATALDTVCVVEKEHDVVLLSSVAILRPNPHRITSHYLRYFLENPSTRSYMKGGLVTGAAIPRVVLKDFKRCPVRVPDLRQQTAVSGILRAYDDLIGNSTRRMKVLEEMAQMLYREWFVYFRFPGQDSVKMVESELGPIPEAWSIQPLADVYRTGSGGTPSRKVPSYFGGSIRWVKTQELQDGFILDADEKITHEGLKNSSAKLHPPGTVLMAMYGATIGKLGILVTEATCNQACCAMIPKEPHFGREYLFLTLLNRRSDILALRMGAAQQNISQEVIKVFPLLCPTPDVMACFTRTVAPVMALVGLLQAKTANLLTTRDFLLPKLISGEIPVEAAAELVDQPA
jgi:type I restriction enzyme S subunit